MWSHKGATAVGGVAGRGVREGRKGNPEGGACAKLTETTENKVYSNDWRQISARLRLVCRADKSSR